MRTVIQRVKECTVTAENEILGRIGPGLLVLLGVAEDDAESDADFLAVKIPALRIFEDENGKMNRSLVDIGGSLLVVSQFTLLGDCRKGRRPSFGRAASPDKAIRLYTYFLKCVQRQGIPVESGNFGAMMAVRLINDGPVTLILESKENKQVGS